MVVDGQREPFRGLDLRREAGAVRSTGRLQGEGATPIVAAEIQDLVSDIAYGEPRNFTLRIDVRY